MIDGARILLGPHINDFVITCAHRQVLDGIRARLLDAFEGTYEGDLRLQYYLGGDTRHGQRYYVSVPDPLR